MTKQQQIISDQLARNVADAPTKAAREFATKLLENYKWHVIRDSQPKVVRASVFSRFADSLEDLPRELHLSVSA